MDSFKSKIDSSYQATLKKGVAYFTKTCQNKMKVPWRNPYVVLSTPKTREKRKKMGKLIPVQVTAKSRRDYTHRGRVVGTLGMRPKDQENIVQMVVREEDDNVYHTLPKQKVKNKQVHSLTNSAECWC